MAAFAGTTSASHFQFDKPFYKIRCHVHRMAPQMSKPIIPIVLAAACLSGCTGWMARQMVESPGEHVDTPFSPETKRKLESALELETFKLPVTNPPAQLAVTVVPPRDYWMRYDFKPSHVGKPEIDIHFATGDALKAARGNPRGTVIVLPGATMGRYSMLPWAMGLAEQGYRTVLMDWRGHGDSTGQYFTYGIRESRDVRALARELESRGELTPPLVLFGASMGAATALETAPNLPQVKAVVAMESYESAPEAIDGVGRALFPSLSPFVSEARLQTAIDRASTIAGVDLRTARPIDSVKDIHVPVLFIHGQADDWLSPRDSMDLFRAKNGSASLWVVPGASHEDLPMRYDELRERVFDWLDSVLAPASANTSGTRSVSPEVSS